MKWERLSLAGDGKTGVTTAYRLMPATPPDRVILAVHGAGNDALFGWIGLFKRLLLGSSAVLTFDLPGHGRSNRDRFTAEAGRTAIHTALAECRMVDSQAPIHAIGVSLGGALLLHALADTSVNPASATLVVAPLRIELSLQSFLGELRPHNFATVVRQREHYGLTGLVPSFGPFKRETYPLRLAERPPAGAFGYVDVLNAALAGAGLEDAAQHVRTPVLLVYGARDRIVPVTQGRRLAERIPDATLAVIPDGSHLSTPLDPEAEDRIVRWIEEHG
jgi:pimeloyl-ACP methyl ester carboxylesterase